jgi:hypothetical protein
MEKSNNKIFNKTEYKQRRQQLRHNINRTANLCAYL